MNSKDPDPEPDPLVSIYESGSGSATPARSMAVVYTQGGEDA
jgi:hypothetical protein